MKTLLLTVASLVILAAVPVRAGSQPALKAEVIGTVQTQTLLSPVDGRIHTSVLNNKRIFEEFQVSKADYELVFDINSGGGLVLQPKHASGGLPTLVVMPLGSSSAEAVNTKTRVIVITSSLGTSTATNLFKDLAGETAGAIHFSGSLNSAVITKVTLSVLASGTDPGGNGGAGLKFKITTKGVFNQAP